jgi:hypothetical protein
MQSIGTICLLMFMNGVYLFISFNMESIVAETSEVSLPKVIASNLNIADTRKKSADGVESDRDIDFSLSDLLDLDILDFDPEELEILEDNEEQDFTSTDFYRKYYWV